MMGILVFSIHISINNILYWLVTYCLHNNHKMLNKQKLRISPFQWLKNTCGGEGTHSFLAQENPSLSSLMECVGTSPFLVAIEMCPVFSPVLSWGTLHSEAHHTSLTDSGFRLFDAPSFCLNDFSFALSLQQDKVRGF